MTSVVPLAGNQILEVVLIDGSVMHMTPDLSHFIYRDELYELSAEGPQNITQNRNNPKRAERLAAVTDSQTVVFKAKGEQKALMVIPSKLRLLFWPSLCACSAMRPE